MKAWEHLHICFIRFTFRIYSKIHPYLLDIEQLRKFQKIFNYAAEP